MVSYHMNVCTTYSLLILGIFRYRELLPALYQRTAHWLGQSEDLFLSFNLVFALGMKHAGIIAKGSDDADDNEDNNENLPE
jgi:hypothetical protein